MTGRRIMAGVAGAAAFAALTGVAVGIAGVNTAHGDVSDWTDHDAFADADD
ncbi:hypothetical protein [Actinocorallia aurantiaca]|uniref:Uncharacterized protein n=1 Tax=Actinocorallia aurantiaca TaxID=46204 RepID=A0ABN3UNA9_9ACTN